MQARAAVRDVGRALAVPYSKCDQIAKMIPIGKQGFQMTLDKALDMNAGAKRYLRARPGHPAHFGYCQKTGRLRAPRLACTPPALSLRRRR